MDLIRWRKSKQSSEHGDACVEVAQFPGAVGVRDSMDPEGPKLLLSRRAFRDLLLAVNAVGE